MEYQHPPDVRYVVTKITRCQECGGTGIMRHPAWGLYDKYGNGKDAIQWFKHRGYKESEIPDEEGPCDGCDGNAYITRPCDLQEALIALGVMTP